MENVTKLEERNSEVLYDIFKTVVRTMDYVGVKNNDTKLISAITGKNTTNSEDDIKLSLDVISSIISKQVRNKFKL